MDKTTINLYRGDDDECIAHLWEVQEDNSLQPLVLRDAARLDLWASARGKVVISLSSTTDDIEVLDADGGVVLLKFKHETTAGATWLMAEYDLQITYNSGRVKTPIRAGRINLQHDVTPHQGASG